MNRVHVSDFRGADDLRDVQVTFAAARRADADGFIGKADVQGVAVGFGIHGDGLYAQFPASGKNAEGDFAAISYQNFSEHFPRRKTNFPAATYNSKLGAVDDRQPTNANDGHGMPCPYPIAGYFFRCGRIPKSASPYSTG